MAEENLKKKAVNGVAWRLVDVGGKKFVTFFVSIILARLIMPDQFGMIAMLGVFTGIAGVFVDSGFSTALIRKNNRTQADCSTVYWFNILVSITCYIILFFCAPWVSDFYGMPQLTAILRVTSLGIILGSLSGVHSTILSAEMKFKTATKISFTATLISAVVGVAMAYAGFEVWALVAQSLSSTVVSTVMTWFAVKWRPSFMISRQSFREFFNFGWKLLGSGLLDTIYGNIYSIVIGKIYKASELAFYNRAQGFTVLAAQVPTSLLQSVTYPTLCKLQDNDDQLRNAYLRIIRLCAFIVFPLCLGFGAVAYPMINVLLTERWIYAATLLSIICFQAMWFPIHAVNLNYLIVKGRSDLFFRLEIIKKILGVSVLCITIPMGLEAMCYGAVVSSVLCLFINTYYTGKFLNLTIWKQMQDMIPSLLLSVAMFLCARLTANALGNGMVSLICSILVGAAIYIGGAFIFRFPQIKEIRTLRK